MNGTLNEKEAHPAVYSALRYLNGVLSDPFRSAGIQHAFSSCAIENNRLGEICSETLHRALTGQPVSDRYLLGLAWAVREMDEGFGREDKDTCRS